MREPKKVLAFRVGVLFVLMTLSIRTTFATCPIIVTPFHGLSSSFEQCGPNAVGFGWFHGRAVQRIIGAFDQANSGNQASGHDSGPNQTIGDNMFLDGPNGGPGNGSYLADADFYDPRWDGCITNIPENSSGCNGSANLGVLDFVITGVDPAVPNVARMALLSVDFNEYFLTHILDNAGAPAVDGDPCGADALSFLTSPVNCTPIPVPAITGASPASGGTNVQVSIGSTSAIPLLDDCLIAEDKASNCPRNLYIGRVLMYRHGACTPVAPESIDPRVWIYPAPPASGTLTVVPNWRVYSVEDANLNGLLDAGEDGIHGGTVNGALDPFIIPGTEVTSTSIFVPAVAGASDCIFLAMAIGLDSNHLSINPPADTLLGEMVISPEVSFNSTPIPASSITPVTDKVTMIGTSKMRGAVTVDWETSVELVTAGFNLIVVKNNGAEWKLNDALIAAKEGTSGRGGRYTSSYNAGSLKGAHAVFVELVKLDGSKERFGPTDW
ncbi:MAG TPA: hypothetical protein VFW45_10285 [Candidatus Polarisedimenticolia bacterium]|nr:hypothetical protein [Candidatus Polarisedimenticolia bacterium]